MKFVGYILFVGSVLLACKRSEKYEGVHLVAHACSGLLTTTAPFHDNSLEAFNYARSLNGVDGIEVDVQLSADTTVWLFHDYDLEKETNGTGCLSDATDAYLQTLRYSSLEQEKLIRLEDLPNDLHGKTLFLDVRMLHGCTNEPLDVNMVFQAIQKVVLQKGWENFRVIVGNPAWGSVFSAFGKELYLNAYHWEHYQQVSNAFFAGPCIRALEISKQDIEEIHANGKKVIIFDVRSPKGTREALKKSPDFLMVDDARTAIIEKYR